MKGEPCTLVTAPTLMGIDAHWETRSFILAPTHIFWTIFFLGDSFRVIIINDIIKKHSYKGAVVYIDDILLYSETMEEHIALVQDVLKMLAHHSLFVKLSKYEFYKSELFFLGYKVFAEGVWMDPRKVKPVVEWETPRTWCQLQSFLCFANFYCPFTPNFAHVALPLTKLLKTKGKAETKVRPNSLLRWSAACDNAFTKLKGFSPQNLCRRNPITSVNS